MSLGTVVFWLILGKYRPVAGERVGNDFLRLRISFAVGFDFYAHDDFRCARDVDFHTFERIGVGLKLIYPL